MLLKKVIDSDYDSAGSEDFDEKVPFVEWKWPNQVIASDVSF